MKPTWSGVYGTDCRERQREAENTLKSHFGCASGRVRRLPGSLM
jgi:hypothetical protein